MNTIKISRIEWAAYATVYLFVSFLIFRINDDTIPLYKLANWQYAIPTFLYSFFVMIFILGLSQFTKMIFRNRVVVITLSVCIGGIVGLKVLWYLTNWIFS